MRLTKTESWWKLAFYTVRLKQVIPPTIFSPWQSKIKCFHHAMRFLQITSNPIWFIECTCYGPEVHGTLLKKLPGQNCNFLLAWYSYLFKDFWRTSQTYQDNDEWFGIPFSLMNAPSRFQRVMDHCLRNYRDNVLISYLYHLIFSKTFEEHLSHIKLMMNGLECQLL